MSAFILLQRLSKKHWMIALFISFYSFDSRACPPERLRAFPLQGNSTDLPAARGSAKSTAENQHTYVSFFSLSVGKSHVAMVTK